METDQETEVTPAMAQAGWDVLAASGVADDLLEADKLTLAEVYRAMFRLAPEHHPVRDSK